MNYKLIDGVSISKNIKNTIKEEISIISKNIEKPIMAIILVGGDESTKIYVRSKQKACKLVGIQTMLYDLPEDTTEEFIINLIYTLNKSRHISGIIVELPLPKHINSENIFKSISPLKDLDCANPYNLGLLYTNNKYLAPATAESVVKLIKESNINIEGKHCVIIGRSNSVGKPLALLLLQENATVTICHSKTKNLSKITSEADILVSCAGKEKIVTKDMVKQNAVVIDVGINVSKEGNLCGDVDFENVKDKASYITPVPGGVGPVTVSMILQNCLKAYKIQNNL